MNEKENKWDKTWTKLYKIKHDPEVLQSERRAGGRKHCWEAPNTLHSWKDILREGCGPYTLGEVSGKTIRLEGIFPFTPMKGHFSVRLWPIPTAPLLLEGPQDPQAQCWRQWKPSPGFLHTLASVLLLSDLWQVTQPLWTQLSYLLISSFTTLSSALRYGPPGDSR